MTTGQQQLLKALDADDKSLRSYADHLRSIRSGSHFVQKDILNNLARQLRLVKSLSLADQFEVPQDHHCFDNVQFLRSFLGNQEWFYQEVNRRFMAYQAARYCELFGRIESYGLTQKQAEAAVVGEHSNLVIAGAGTGKTSTLIARVAYLIFEGKAREEQILVLAYNKSAAEELQNRITERTGYSVKVKTFHALGLEILRETEPDTPKGVSDEATDKIRRVRLIQRLVKEAANDAEMLQLMLSFFMNQLKEFRDSFSFNSRGEYLDYLKTQELRSFCGEGVKSRGELVIANFLYRHGLDYEYEAPYPYRTELDGARKYQPDFTVTIGSGEQEYQVFIEFWGVNKAGQPAPYIDAVHYRNGMKRKRKVHRDQGTVLLELYHYQLQDQVLEQELTKELAKLGVELNAKANQDIFQDLEKKTDLNGRSLISNFAELTSDVLGMYRANGSTIPELYARARRLFNGERAQRAEVFIRIFSDIADRYQRYLDEQNSLDFDAMIACSTEHVCAGRYRSPYTQILVDEFQDISAARAGLVKALRDQVPACCLFCVGDDWQAIYQFNGADITLINQFADHFGDAYQCVLDQTFRFNNRIADVSGRFVMQNPRQIPKTITPRVQVNEPKVFYSVHDKGQEEEVILGLLNRIDGLRQQERESVYILCRYGEKKKKLNKKHIQQNAPPALNICFQTVHQSKGGEADHVIIRQMSKGRLGFPSRMTSDSLMDLVLAEPDPYEQAEERRLFYVALTRARDTVYLLVPEVRQSEFMDELLDRSIKPNYEIEMVELNGPRPKPRNCPECASGQVVNREGRSGPFYGCSNYPYCNFNEPHPKPQVDPA